MISMDQKRKALEEIRAANGGVVSADVVIVAARNPDHVLHPLFPWDVQQAAQEHWRDIARGIIREVTVQVRIHKRVITSVCYVRDPDADPREQRSIAITEIERRSEHAHRTIIAELERIESAVNRARGIAGVLDLADDFDQLLEEVIVLREKMDSPPIVPQPPRGRSKGRRGQQQRKRGETGGAHAGR